MKLIKKKLSFFKALVSVWKSDETLFLMFDIKLLYGKPPKTYYEMLKLLILLKPRACLFAWVIFFQSIDFKLPDLANNVRELGQYIISNPFLAPK